jgi:hypothetical protein
MGHWRQAKTGEQRFQRVAMAVPVRISTIDPEIDPTTGKSFFRSAEETTANLSKGGAYLRSWEPLGAGRRVIVTIELPSSEELQLSARVVWTRRELRPSSSDALEEPGYGVEFYGISSRELARLERLIDRLDSRRQPVHTTKATTPNPHP